ncbi:hypothetical protein [Streptomyces bambusae]|uniref:Resolvase/invertase-type recombinase catalytic domain-containing protein n=1 Tax=Streptomyces bambusae TaxID=1550616 RepID=A0ABS6Z1E7_9ACTN|nr:hypothetical protein [Streptomyces bambusae]MBW5480636.1 hypothetical protein [Streptomyces bambusae]
MPHRTSREPIKNYMSPPASYLCCPHYDPQHMTGHQEALSRFSHRLGAPPPVTYLDNGHSCQDHRPALERLARAVMAGQHSLVLVPGLWVFSADEHRAQRTADLLTRAGGCRVLQLPAPLEPRRWW